MLRDPDSLSCQPAASCDNFADDFSASVSAQQCLNVSQLLQAWQHGLE